MINTQNISTKDLQKKKPGFFSSQKVLPDEIDGVVIEQISVKGPYQIKETATMDVYDVLLTIKGEANIEVEKGNFKVGRGYIVRLPYKKPYIITTGKGREFHFLRFRKSLDQADQDAIAQTPAEHSEIYLKAIEDCPVYTEDIKSSKTLNRMILPEGMVPRFCMGSVSTDGPDEVAEHEHAMLDQLFFGIDGCKCICVANGEKQVLEENMMLHIPLGSKHSVSVERRNTLSYIWFDFFFTLEGQHYMGEQHKFNNGQ